MENDASPPLKRMKHEIKELEVVGERLNGLKEKRLQMDKEIKEVEKQKENLMKQSLQKNSPIDESTHDELSEESSKLKAERQHLDDQIDALGEAMEAEERLEALRDELINTILERHPDKQDEYQEWESKIQTIEKRRQEADGVFYLSVIIHQPFEAAILTWELAKRRSILHYLFGRSPAIKITALLKDVKQQCEVVLRSLEELSAQLPPDSVTAASREQLSTLAQQIKLETSKNWGSKTFEETFVPLFDALTKAREALSTQVTALTIEAGEIKSGLEAWVENYS